MKLVVAFIIESALQTCLPDNTGICYNKAIAL